MATRRIPDIYKTKPNTYLNTNPNSTNPTSILCKDSRKDFTLHTVESLPKYFTKIHIVHCRLVCTVSKFSLMQVDVEMPILYIMKTAFKSITHTGG